MVKGENICFIRCGNLPIFIYKMKVMFFVDLENFKESLWKINRNRQPDIKNMHFFLFDYFIKKFNWEIHSPRLVRAYFYTGEYTDSMISKIKQDMLKYKKESYEYKKIDEFINKISSRKDSQEKLLNFAKYQAFVEIKKTPLHYNPGEAIKNSGLFQKGIDVLMAVDLVAHAFQNDFDVAIVCSGDVDLLESLKLIKILGKNAILVSHSSLISKNMIEESDYFCKLEKLEEADLDKISRLVIREKY